MSQLAKIHGLTVRDFARIFGMSKSHAEDVLAMRCFPRAEMCIQIARYFEVSTDDIFGWMIDDAGERRPLVIELYGTGKVLRLKAQVKEHGSLALVKAVAEEMRKL